MESTVPDFMPSRKMDNSGKEYAHKTPEPWGPPLIARKMQSIMYGTTVMNPEMMKGAAVLRMTKPTSVIPAMEKSNVA
ncbi:MAG: hypothetical protein BWY20_00665 [Spirochaetes bacterium ADurb.Bin215]|nr:MAG: hypothetical protein BWY20_00665 [Spirochaetes bacterium ADurb.Bin215]